MDDQMETERRIAELTAQTVIARLIEIAKDPKLVDEITEVWSNKFDETLGRGFRRAVWYLVIAIMGIASVKLGLIEKLASLFRP